MFNSYRYTRIACYAGYITQAMVNVFMPLLFVRFNAQFGISLQKIGLLVTVNFMMQLAVDLLSSLFVDKIGYRVSAVAAHAFCVAGFLLMSVLPFVMNPYAGLIIAIFFNAVGGGLIEVLISPIIEAIPGDNKSSSMSLLHSFYCWGSLGVILVSTLFFNLFSLDNWHVLTRLLAIVPLLNGLLFTQVPVERTVELHRAMKMGELFRNRKFLIFLVLMFCAGASELSMSQWASAFAEKGLNVSKTEGDLLGPCFFAALMGISRVLYSKIGRKVDLSKYIMLCACACILTYLVACLSPSPLIALFGCAACGFTVGVMWPGVFSEGSAALPEGGTNMFAMYALAGDLGCASGPTLVGFVSDSAKSGLKAGLLTAIIFPAVMIAGTFILMKTKKASE